jgi:short-chain fatty acids transporter
MLARLGARLARVSARWVPDPFVIALVLTAAVAALAILRLQLGGGPAHAAAADVALGWIGGFSDPGGLAFAMQMCLILVTGHAMADSPPVQRLVVAIARLPGSAAGASALVAAVSCVAALVHWGLGAVVGAFLAREIARHAPARGLRVHYPIMAAAAYSWMTVWHGGLSGSAPLKMAEAGSPAAGGTVPLAATLGSPMNLAIVAAMCALVPLCFALMTPRQDADLVPADPAQLPPLRPRSAPVERGLVAWLQDSTLVGRALGGAGLVGLAAAAATGHLALDLNSVNLGFLFAGLALQGGLGRYVEAVSDGARGAGGIILQFPFYYGIVGVMKAGELIPWLSGALAEVSSRTTFPLFAFLSAGLVNFAIPSGGGQWAVQGDVLLAAGAAHGVDPGATIVAFAHGDAWTNLLQPFWALPLLGVTGLHARDIFGYTAVIALVMGVVVAALLLLPW